MSLDSRVDARGLQKSPSNFTGTSKLVAWEKWAIVGAIRVSLWSESMGEDPGSSMPAAKVVAAGAAALRRVLCNRVALLIYGGCTTVFS